MKVKGWYFPDIGTRGGSLASSRGYLEIAGNAPSAHPGNQSQQRANHTSPLYSKYTDQSLLSFCSNVSSTTLRVSLLAFPQQCTSVSVQSISIFQRYFFLQVSEATPCTGSNVERFVRDQHRWSDSECCHLAYELHNLHHGPPWNYPRRRGKMIDKSFHSTVQRLWNFRKMMFQL